MKTIDDIVRQALQHWCRARRRVLERGARQADVHQWRIATRRLFAIARLCLPARAEHGLGVDFERAFRAAGRLRDVQVTIDLVRRLQARYPVAEAFASWLRRRLPRRRSRVLRRLERVDVRDVRKVVRGWLDPPNVSAPVTRVRDGLMARAARRLERALLGIASERSTLSQRSAPPAFHRLRVEVKSARYMADCLAAAGGKARDRATARRLASWQLALGDIADVGALARLLERFVRKQAPRRQDATLLRFALERRQRMLCAAFLRKPGLVRHAATTSINSPTAPRR